MASKKLTLALLKEDAKKTEKKQRVQLTEDIHAFIYPVFAPSKIKDMTEEFLRDYVHAEEKNLDLKKIPYPDWLTFHLIKTFSDLEIPKEVNKKLALFLEIRDAEFYSKLVQAFPQESIVKAIETATALLEQVQKIIKHEGGKLDRQKADKAIEETLEKGIVESEELTETIAEED
ncbi:hypothetical protein P8917_09000 [Bacillus atrophaeus]|uniref:hypothetical protein n=1 Tax=Bacillus atrophaeus TaxID=1452 RepID=UPI00227DAB00|nr:hypothetical protein [Bacillus atrophaeus]MCY8814978.1 hypothetical protein [Bacillus atrophaeus]MCY8823328.1 hypothetical protein [Bacillus atrophaeus]MCY8834859.1 hypothetical protein [Bacillus atrophaeus]MEC0748374.1 hypothetical protein [Bacillus atrophaeus]MEC0802463.1 hypothetical protein [Bacillus atrophaeus]